MKAPRFIVRREAPVDAGNLPDDLHPVLKRVYAARAVHDPADLDRSLERLLPVDALSGMEGAVALLEEALARGQRVLVVGDYDADGATSCALTVRALRTLGAAWVDYLVPNRFEFGYGLSPELVAVAAERRPDLIITVDNGIANFAGVAAAVARGIRVLVTDHHLPAEDLPAADAIVNPNLPGDPFPSKHLAGVGVVFYVLLALRAHLRRGGWFDARPEPNMAQFLDLVAVGTVADVVPLDRNNRILVEQGLRRIRAGMAQPGVTALLAVAGRTVERTVAADLGFAVGPRLNAAGRLEDMALGIECLLTDDAGRAGELAEALNAINTERREIESQMREQALAALSEWDRAAPDTELPAGLCLYDPDWHQGVIGILASRIKERVHRPVVAFARAGEGELKGSARSVPGLHIRDALARVAAREPGLIARFGGHAMAAGLSVPEAGLEAFRAAFQAEAAAQLDAAALTGTLYTDGELRAEELRLELAELLREAGPWGQGFPEPVFDGWFRVVDGRIVGQHHLKLRLVHEPDGGAPVEAIAFHGAEHAHAAVEGAQVRMAYRLDVNEFRGVRRVQLVVEHLDVGEGAA